MNVKFFIFNILCFFILYGCVNEPSGIVRIKMNDISEKASGSSLNSIVDSLKIIEINSEETLFGNVKVIGEADQKIYGYSSAGDFFIFNNEGQLLKTFNYKGRGPGEYISIWSAKLDELSKQILVLDLNNKLLKFSPEGELMEENTGGLVRSLSDIAPLGDGNYAGTVLNADDKQNNVVVFDPEYRVLNKFFPVRDISQTNTAGMVNIESVEIFNSGVTYRAALGDTLYRVFSSRTEPLLAINQGGLKMPVELSIKAGEKAHMQKSKYINNFYGKLAGRYYLGSYWYKDCNYYELWDLKDGKNIIHQPLDKELYEKGLRAGLPLKIDDRVMYIWPGYVQNNVLYAVCDYSYFHQLELEEDENKNPVLVKIWLKK